tara:strand:+ start:537 stop:1163 length:627 start_codon:yes stop_codon:yes gene_type:complete
MSNRYLDEAGEITSKQIDTTIKDRADALGFFKLMGIKAIQTERQEKNGTTVYELPIRKLSYTGNSYAYRYAIYDSGYIRNVSEHCHSPWYINKRYITKTKYWNSYYKEYGEYVGNKPVFIENFEDQLVYLANYILKNRYGSKLYSCCDFNIEQIREQRKFMHDAKWEGNTVTISRDEYNELKKANPLALNFGIDKVEVFINGQRYNLS